MSRDHERQLESRADELEQERQNVKAQLDRERLVRVTSEVIETITSPEFLERMQRARAASDDSAGLDAAAELLSLEGLRAAGAEIPEDFRMTSRVFEDRASGVRVAFEPMGGRDGGLGPRGPEVLSWGVCGGGGGLIFCACGGFST